MGVLSQMSPVDREAAVLLMRNMSANLGNPAAVDAHMQRALAAGTPPQTTTRPGAVQSARPLPPQQQVVMPAQQRVAAQHRRAAIMQTWPAYVQRQL